MYQFNSCILLILVASSCYVPAVLTLSLRYNKMFHSCAALVAQGSGRPSRSPVVPRGWARRAPPPSPPLLPQLGKAMSKNGLATGALHLHLVCHLAYISHCVYDCVYIYICVCLNIMNMQLITCEYDCTHTHGHMYAPDAYYYSALKGKHKSVHLSLHSTKNIIQY